MKRKLIRQGGSGLTMYVPKKWVDENHLKPGDEVEVERMGENLLLSSKAQPHPLKEITLSLEDRQESTLRTLLVNAYRAGYDRITLSFEGNPKDLLALVADHLIGFEIVQEKTGNYVVESVAEPSYENFENLIQKQFYILLDILHNLESDTLPEQVYRLQKYDNFLKRCLSKKVLVSEALPFLWQLLSDLTHAARQCYHVHQYLHKNQLRLNQREKIILEQVQAMLALLQKGYLTQSLQFLSELHEKGRGIVYKRSPALLLEENPILIHYLITIARTIYLANSPLTGIIQLVPVQKAEPLKRPAQPNP